jgi:hypothetical protein
VFGEVNASRRCVVPAGGDHGLDDVGEVDRIPARKSALAGGEHEQRLDEPFLVFTEGERNTLRLPFDGVWVQARDTEPTP